MHYVLTGWSQKPVGRKEQDAPQGDKTPRKRRLTEVFALEGAVFFSICVFEVKV